MPTWCRQIALLLAIVVMPLQGIAATASFLFCHMADARGAAHAHDHAATSDNDGGPAMMVVTGTHELGDFCSHHFTSALPVAAFSAATPGLQSPDFSAPTLNTHFIPDRPQRPPQA